MLDFLEYAIVAYGEYEDELAFDCLEEAEYYLRESGERSSSYQELMKFINDIMYAHRQNDFDRASLYTKMAIDVATLPRLRGYVRNETGLKTAMNELDRHTNTPC